MAELLSILLKLHDEEVYVAEPWNDVMEDVRIVLDKIKGISNE